MAEPHDPPAWLRIRSDALVDPERPSAFLRLRRIVTAVEAPDGELSEEGTWDFAERPAGLDAVVVVVYRRAPGGLEVQLRSGLRVPASIGRPEDPRGPGRRAARFVEEVVAGLVEAGEESDEGLRERARLEVLEEVGLSIAVENISPLGAPLWATPGLCAEVLHYFAADATYATCAPAVGDGSPFESHATTRWYPLDDAIARVAAGDRGPGDLRAELGLRRLAAWRDCAR